MPVSRWARGDEVEVSDDSVERARRVAKTLGRRKRVMRPRPTRAVVMRMLLLYDTMGGDVDEEYS